MIKFKVFGEQAMPPPPPPAGAQTPGNQVPLTPEQIEQQKEQERAQNKLATMTGNPVDKIIINPDEKPNAKIQTEQTIIERVVNLLQRRKRAISMKRRMPKMAMKRKILKSRMASNDKLRQRAMRMAKQMIRKKIAGIRGVGYSGLGTSEKINIDTRLKGREASIQALARRIMPMVKRGEIKRLSAVQSGKSTKGVYGNIKKLNQEYEVQLFSNYLGESITVDDLNLFFTMYEASIGQSLKSIAGAPLRVAGNLAKAGLATGAVLNTMATPRGFGGAALAGTALAANALSTVGKGDGKVKGPSQSDMNKMNKMQQDVMKQKVLQSKEQTKQAKTSTAMGKSALSKTKQPTPKEQAAYQQQKTNVLGDIKKTVGQKISAFNQKMKGKASIDTVSKAGTQPAKTTPVANTSSTIIIPPTYKTRPSTPSTTIVSHKEWDYEAYLQEKADTSLSKKAEKYGLAFEEVKDIFEQGLADYDGRETATPHQFAMQRVNSKLAEGKGLWANIHAKRARIKAGSSEKMRKPGSEGAPTKQNLIDAQEAVQPKSPHDKFKAGLKKSGYDADKGADRLLALIAKQKAERAEHEKKYAHLYAEDVEIKESFIVDRASGYSGVYTAADLGIKMQGGFQLHPSVMEDGGAGDIGTDKLTNKYKKDTPGEQLEAAVRMMRAKRKANQPC